MQIGRLVPFSLAAAVFVSGCSTARELEDTGVDACAACHGAPPPPFITGATAHPASTSCHLCHADTVDADGDLVPGGAHGNGKVELSSHAVPFAGHSAAALGDIAACTGCHGAEYDGGESGRSCDACHQTFGHADWKTNCTFCHGQRTPGWTVAELVKAAPPQGALGEELTSVRQVGAHAKHLGVGSAISDGVACDECHAIPDGLGHLDGIAAVTFGTLARPPGGAAAYDGGTCSSTYCHGATLSGGSNPSPTWTGSAPCGSCHGSPPATGRHAIPAHTGQLCVNCHLGVADPLSVAIASDPAARALHVNGTTDVAFPEAGSWSSTEQTCSSVACHRGAEIRSWND